MTLEELNPSLTSCQSLALSVLEGKGNVFLSGEAGSGKSFTIRQFLRDRSLQTFPVLASTGAAAVLVGGRTFHSFMGLGILEGGVDLTVQRALRDRRLVKRINEIEGFVLDEVSMISGPTLRAADIICRWGRERLHEPWGGLRVIAVGDFSQLPPVDRSQKRPWAFLEPAWLESGFTPCFLKQNMRTQNSEFLAVLNDVRRGRCTSLVADFLRQRRRDPSTAFDGTRLFPRRDQAESYNLRRLADLQGEALQFPSEYSGSARHIEQLKKSSPLPEVLSLKVGALVMLRQNDPRQRWINGTTGWVKELTREDVRLELMNGRQVAIEPVTFQMLDADGTPVASVRNFPLSLAYATTIHKAQGMTLDSLAANLRGLWEPGQAYVALSRVRDPESLYLEDYSERSIMADPEVEKFYSRAEREPPSACL